MPSAQVASALQALLLAIFSALLSNPIEYKADFLKFAYVVFTC